MRQNTLLIFSRIRVDDDHADHTESPQNHTGCTCLTFPHCVFPRGGSVGTLQRGEPTGWKLKRAEKEAVSTRFSVDHQKNFFQPPQYPSAGTYNVVGVDRRDLAERSNHYHQVCGPGVQVPLHWGCQVPHLSSLVFFFKSKWVGEPD